MARYPRLELPAGYVLRTFSDGTFQAYLERDPRVEGPRVTRRAQAVKWAWVRVGMSASPPERAETGRSS